jgi:hypothetical protein
MRGRRFEPSFLPFALPGFVFAAVRLLPTLWAPAWKRVLQSAAAGRVAARQAFMIRFVVGCWYVMQMLVGAGAVLPYHDGHPSREWAQENAEGWL